MFPAIAQSRGHRIWGLGTAGLHKASLSRGEHYILYFSPFPSELLSLFIYYCTSQLYVFGLLELMSILHIMALISYPFRTVWNVFLFVGIGLIVVKKIVGYLFLVLFCLCTLGQSGNPFKASRKRCILSAFQPFGVVSLTFYVRRQLLSFSPKSSILYHYVQWDLSC